MEIKIREAKQEDYKSIYELNKNSLGYDYDINKTAGRISDILKRPEYKLLVAETGEAVAGYIHASAYDCTYSDPVINILALAVDSEKRGLGIGRRLLSAAEDWAAENNCVGVRLSSGYDRTGAHQFYQACGYNNRKDQKNFVKLLDM